MSFFDNDSYLTSVLIPSAAFLFLRVDMIARLARAYDYRSFGHVLLRGASPLYDAVLIK